MDCAGHCALLSNETTLLQALEQMAQHLFAKRWATLTRSEIFHALSMTVRDCLTDGLIETEERYSSSDIKRVYYLSIEFLPGRLLYNNMQNLGMLNICRQALQKAGISLDSILEEEPDPGLGNGGLGRLAACFLDSMATLGIPGYGYGINYEFGLFRQEIDDGSQKEEPDHWLSEESPWQIRRTDEFCAVPLYGRIDHGTDKSGNYNPMWLDFDTLLGVPYDMPVVGYGGKTINRLRLFSARAANKFDMQIFNDGDYLKAVERQITTEKVTKLLYPSDSIKAGQELRLVQEYFLVACSLRNILRHFDQGPEKTDGRRLPQKVAAQLNDTHPALAVAELMRFLVDHRNLPWDTAWEITQATLAYTNHTLLPEALERWSAPLLQRVLPRHIQIIYEINRRFMQEVVTLWPTDTARQGRLSIVEGNGEQQSIRMAHLAIVGSHSINGVAALHSDLVKTSLVPDFYQLWPERFNNKTNGVTPRRWMLQANPGLSELITRRIGPEWVCDLGRLRQLERFAEDMEFQQEFMQVKLNNKQKLADEIWHSTRLEVDPASMFDTQVKRIHEYKRQLLNVLHIIHQYLCIVEDNRLPPVPKTYIFGGKAAPGYWAAKQIIRLINMVAKKVNNDPRASEFIKVVFMKNYQVSLAEIIMPAADLSEQISTAGKEASGTSNMKFAMNGALTIGTLDGANIEIMEEVGPENIYIFGLKAAEVQTLRQTRSYRPAELYASNPYLRRVMDSLNSSLFCPNEPGLFCWLYQALVYQGDEYFHLADFPYYVRAQELASADYQQKSVWTRKAILNVARMGKFSSDRTIQEYARDIWNVKPCL